MSEGAGCICSKFLYLCKNLWRTPFALQTFHTMTMSNAASTTVTRAKRTFAILIQKTFARIIRVSSTCDRLGL